jgi:hypothetical protein
LCCFLLSCRCRRPLRLLAVGCLWVFVAHASASAFLALTRAAAAITGRIFILSG